MKEALLRKLVEKGYFAVGSEIDVGYTAVDFTGAKRAFQNTFTVSMIGERRSDRSLVFKIFSINDGSHRSCGLEDIRLIEGMTPERFAENYMIDPDGEEIGSTGARRGRRPKWLIEAEANQTMEEDDFLDEAA